MAILAFVLVLLSPFDVSAQEGAPVSSRYFVKTEKNIWKKTLNARHVFKGGFTADLSPIQLNIAKFMGIETQRLPVYQISPLFLDEPKSEDAEKIPTKAKRLLPDTQIPKNIQLINSDVSSTASMDFFSEKDQIKVAVLDTGIFADHPDIHNNLVDCKDFTTFSATVTDNRCLDKNGHGTAVSSIIVADGGIDDSGMLGVAPGVALMSYKTCNDSGLCYGDDMAFAIKTAIEEGARIINLSLGADSGDDFILKEAINYAIENKAVIVSSAGNDGPGKNSIDYPAAFDGVISVGAIDNNQNIVSWSSRGAAPSLNKSIEGDIDFVAPGTKIQVANIEDGYSYLSGTSMAAPHVSGLLALILSGDPDINDFVDSLAKNVIDIDRKGPDSNSGFGIPYYSK